MAKRTADGCHSLDVNRLKRKGALTPGKGSSVSWSHGDRRTGSIMILAEERRLVLYYRSRSYGEEWQSVTEPVRLCWTPCHYGGRRPWFVCPGCQRRVGKLYVPGKYFLCRHCYDLAYGSQRDGWSDRRLRKAQNIRMRLGGTANLTEPFPWKPKRMHWRTYDRLRNTANSAEQVYITHTLTSSPKFHTL